jgi:murein DD-endopeptidase MepM/ murein hydrolase activator NlpD
MRRLALVLLVLLALPAAADPRPGFGWPLPGTPSVERGFQLPASAWGPGHRGVDLGGYAGERVLAAGAGRVSYAGMLAGRGVVTVVHAGGLRTTYEPVSPAVHVGQQVAQGDALGALASGHASCPPGTVCLHWGLLRGNSYLDPLGLLLPRRVRLLPLGTAATPEAARQVAATPSGVVEHAQTVAAGGSLGVGLAWLARRRARTRLRPS